MEQHGIMKNGSSAPKKENKKEDEEAKRQIVLSICLGLDILLVAFSFALVLLFAMNIPESEDLEEMPSTGEAVKNIYKVMLLGLFVTGFAWIASMFTLVYTITMVFGNKCTWPCCPWLATQIKKELLSSPIISNDNCNV